MSHTSSLDKLVLSTGIDILMHDLFVIGECCQCIGAWFVDLSVIVVFWWVDGDLVRVHPFINFWAYWKRFYWLIALKNTAYLVFTSGLLDIWCAIYWLIDISVGTAPGQAETYDYSSKMAASKEAAAAAAAKV